MIDFTVSKKVNPSRHSSGSSFSGGGEQPYIWQIHFPPQMPVTERGIIIIKWMSGRQAAAGAAETAASSSEAGYKSILHIKIRPQLSAFSDTK